MQSPTPLKYLIQLDVSDEEIHICYDYYCPTIDTHTSLLDHILWVSRQHRITPVELATTLKKFRAYDTTTACQKCHILKKVTEPNLTLTSSPSPSLKKSVYICESCYKFIASTS